MERSATLKAKLRVSRTMSSLGVVRDWFLSRRTAGRHVEDFSQIEKYVMFAGYPRSGHSLVGSLLNAHPDIVISHQLNALRYVKAGFSREQMLGMIFLSDARFEKKGRTGTKREYAYAVPGQWQGRYRRLRVIGDKNGKAASQTLGDSPELLAKVRALVGVPLHIVHVVRNPYDNITTMARRSNTSLERSADRYFRFRAGVESLRARLPAETWHDLRHENLIAEPRGAIRDLCLFFDVEPAPDYIEAGAGIVYDNPHRSRFEVEWDRALIDSVARRISEDPLLEGYTYEEKA